MDEDSVLNNEPGQPNNPAVARLIARLEEATADGNRDLDAAIALHVEQQEWPHVTVRQLDDEDDNPRGPGSRRECLVREGGTDDWAIVHGGDWGATFPVPCYTTSLDAALTLVLEGAVWHVMTDYGGLNRAKIGPPGRPSASIYHPRKRDELFIQADAETPALAVCIAALKARAVAPPTGPVNPGSAPNTDDPSNSSRSITGTGETGNG